MDSGRRFLLFFLISKMNGFLYLCLLHFKKKMEQEDFNIREHQLDVYKRQPLTHTYSSKENEGAGDVFELKEKGSYVLPIPKSERERNTEIEIFDRPNSEPVNN